MITTNEINSFPLDKNETNNYCNPAFKEIIKSIKSITLEINNLTEQNTTLHSECLRLESDLENVVKMSSLNIKSAQDYNIYLESKNEKLSQYLREKYNLIDEIRMIMINLIHSGVNISKLPNLNIEKLSQITGIKVPQTESTIDPIASQIISTISYFSKCKSNNSFLQRCIQLKSEINQLSLVLGGIQVNQNLKLENEISRMRKKLRKVQFDELCNKKTFTLRIHQSLKERNEIIYTLQNLQ